MGIVDTFLNLFSRDDDAELQAAEAEMHSREVQASRELCSRSYAAFVQEAWPLVEAAPLAWNWHHDRFCSLIEDMFHLRTRDAIVCVPPAHTKSLIFDVFHVPWAWTRDPSLAFGFFSFDEKLLLRDGAKSLDILQSEWYRERWGDVLRSSDPARGNFETKYGGRRFSSSVGGKATGNHFDYRIVDDSVKPQSVLAGIDAGAAIEAVETWWFGTMSTRIRNPATHRTLIVGQRIIQDDLPGKLLKDSKYRRVVYPMRFDSSHPFRTHDDPRTVDGELLWPDRFPESVVVSIETVLGPANAAAQLQQNPGASGGTFVTIEQIQHLDMNLYPSRDRGTIVLSFDFAFKSKASSSFVAAGVWQYVEPYFYLRHATIKRLTFVQSLQLILDYHDAWPEAAELLVEDTANGVGIIDIIQQTIDNVVPISCAGLAKPARFHAVTPNFARKLVIAPDVPPELRALPEWAWVAEWEEQITKFPTIVRNDAVDMSSQALTRLQPTSYQLALDALLSRKPYVEQPPH